jgi:hypothetical protein
MIKIEKIRPVYTFDSSTTMGEVKTMLRSADEELTFFLTDIDDNNVISITPDNLGYIVAYRVKIAKHNVSPKFKLRKQMKKALNGM